MPFFSPDLFILGALAWFCIFFVSLDLWWVSSSPWFFSGFLFWGKRRGSSVVVLLETF